MRARASTLVFAPWLAPPRQGSLKAAVVSIFRHHTGQAPPLLGAVSQQYYTDLQGKISSQSQSVQATINGYTGSQSNTDKIAQGAQAASNLAQNGFDPSNPQDNAELIQAIAGGMCLAGPVGCSLGGAVLGLWTVGNAIGCPVSNAFASIGLGTGCNYGCRTTGNFTPSSALSIHGPSPAPPIGSFAALAWAALAHYAAQQSNCQGGPPPDVIVDAVVAIYNQTHDGPAEAYFVPPLNAGTISIPIVATDDTVRTWNGVSQEDPNVEYAFELLLEAAQSPLWQGVPNYFGPGSNAVPSVTPPRTVMVNAGPLLRPARVLPLAGHAAVYSQVRSTLPPALLATVRGRSGPTAGFFVPLGAGLGVALWLGNPLFAALGLGLGLYLNRKF